MGVRIGQRPIRAVTVAFACLLLVTATFSSCGKRHSSFNTLNAERSSVSAIQNSQEYYPDRIIIGFSRNAEAPSGSSAGGISLPNSVLYQNLGPARLARFLAERYGISISEETYVRNVNWACYQIDTPEHAASLLGEIPSRFANSVMYAEYDGRFEMEYAPNDPEYPSGLWGMVKINAATAWDYGAGEGERIAVIDSGVRYSGNSPDSLPDHEDLAANVLNPPDYWPNEKLDLIEDDNIPDDTYGHGTHVAGIAAAVGDNGVGVVGVAYAAKIIPIKILNNEEERLTYSRAIAGITLATELEANVINMSFMGSWLSKAMSDAITDAHDNGVLLVACVGNKAVTKPWYPAGYPDVIAVGSTEGNDHRSEFSNYGPWVDIAAPGDGILSTYYYSTSAYWVMEGTSMSTPHVAGAGALLMAARPSLSVDQVRAVLEGSGADLDDSEWDNATIRRLDIGAACTYSLGSPPSVSITNPTNNSTVTGTVSITASVSDSDGTVTKVIFYAGDYLLAIDDEIPFSVDWDTTHFPNTTYTIRAIACDDQAQRTTATISATVNNSQLTPDYFNDFEGSNAGWWTKDEYGLTYWHLTTEDSNSPTHCYKMGGLSGAGYDKSEYDLLFSPVFDLSDIEHARVKFWHHYSYADTYDKGYLTVNTGDGEYHVLASYAGEQLSWAQENVLLDDYLDDSIQIVFLMESNHTNHGLGWWVDDFSLVKPSAPPTVDLTSHSDGDIVLGSVTVTADASDDVGISKVEFYVGDNYINSDATPAYAFYYDTNNLHGGDNIFRVTAYDEFPLTASDSASVIVRNHVINSFSPLTAISGAEVDISGNKFLGLGTDAYNPATDRIYFTGASGLVQAEVTDWGKLIIACKVPDDATIGPISVVIGNSASVSSSADFGIRPNITSIAPDAQIVDGIITITGSGFLANQGTSFVSFNGLTAPEVISWGSHEIKVIVPQGATPGLVTVTTQVCESNGVDFTPLPHIKTLSDNRVYVGKLMAIRGTSFGANQGSSSIYFYDNVRVPDENIQTWSQIQLIFTIPSGVSTGDLYVQVGTNESNRVPVTVTLPPPSLGGLEQD